MRAKERTTGSGWDKAVHAHWSDVTAIFFRLYALDTTLGDKGALTKPELENAMRDYVLEKAELVGMYERTKVGAKPKAGATAKAGTKTKAGAN